MRQKTRSSAQSSRSSTKEPLAEGLQIIIPTDSRGRRSWSRLSDEQIVEYAKRIMEENEISVRSKLRGFDGALYHTLKKRGLLDTISFSGKRRPWKDMSDEELVDFARRTMKEVKVVMRWELSRVDSGLYSALRKRGLLEEIGFDDKLRSWVRMSDEDVLESARMAICENALVGRRDLEMTDGCLYDALRKRGLLDLLEFEGAKRSWKDMSDEEIIEHARKVLRENKITCRSELGNIDSRIYSILTRRGLLDKVGFEKKQKKARSWEGMSNDEIIEFTRNLMKERQINIKAELKKVDSGLYGTLQRRGLLDEVGFEEKTRKRRSWKSMTDEEIIELAKKTMKENGIVCKKDLRKHDSGLLFILNRRKLAGRIGFVEKQRSWKHMSNEEVVDFARKIILERSIYGRKELFTSDPGLYSILHKRGLLDRAFANVDQQKADRARDAVIDALEAFVANDNNSAEDDVA